MTRNLEMSKNILIPRNFRQSVVLGTLYTLVGFGCCSLLFGGKSWAEQNTTSISIEHSSLREASARASQLLGIHIILGIDRSHKAYRLKNSLEMPASDRNDVLNALSASYGLRWISGPKANEVTLLDKRNYWGSSTGLRQAVSDAVQPSLRTALQGSIPEGLEKVEGILKPLETNFAPEMERITGAGPVTLDKMDPRISTVLLEYLGSYDAFRLGVACDQFAQELRTNGNCGFHYGQNPAGTRQFSFRMPGNRWISVKPE
jgi:hypothetical protein